MVDFLQQRRRMEPSRSLPMSTLNQRDRTPVALTAGTPTRRRDIIRKDPTTTTAVVRGGGEAPNPYTSRGRRPPHRVMSHSKEAVMATVMNLASFHPAHGRENDAAASVSSLSPSSIWMMGSMERERSSSPSKYAADMNNSLCPSSPIECCIPPIHGHGHGHKRHHPSSSSWNIARALVRALALLMVGFGAGLMYDVWNKNGPNHISSTRRTPVDLESIPSVLLTDELVKKLAHDNQLQEAEIKRLKQQVEEARKSALIREEQHPNNINNNGKKGWSPFDIPDVVVVAGENDQRTELKHNKPLPIKKINASLRAVKRLIWDEQGNVQELDVNLGESAAIFPPSPPRVDQPIVQPPSEPQPQQQQHPHDDHEVNRDNYEEEHRAQLEYQQQQQQQQQQQESQPLQEEPQQAQDEEHHHVEEDVLSITDNQQQDIHQDQPPPQSPEEHQPQQEGVIYVPAQEYHADRQKFEEQFYKEQLQQEQELQEQQPLQQQQEPLLQEQQLQEQEDRPEEQPQQQDQGLQEQQLQQREDRPEEQPQQQENHDMQQQQQQQQEQQ